MTPLRFRFLTLAAFSLFIIFAVASFNPNPERVSVLSGPDTPPDPSPLVLILWVISVLGIVVGYVGILFFSRWARITVLLSALLLIICQAKLATHIPHGGSAFAFVAIFCLASLALAVCSFSSGSALFEKRAQIGVNKGAAPNGGQAALDGDSNASERPPSVS